MLRTQNVILGLIPAFALGILSCTVDPDVEKDLVAEDEATLVTAGNDGFGTYRSFVLAPGVMPVFVLMTDGTYHRAITMPCSTQVPCVPATDDGMFTVRHRGGGNYIDLYSDTGGVNRYEYVLTGTTLRLRQLDKTEYLSMVRTDEAPWCDTRVDCALQNLDEPSCAGGWACGSSTCGYVCMKEPFDFPKPIADPDPN